MNNIEKWHIVILKIVKLSFKKKCKIIDFFGIKYVSIVVIKLYNFNFTL